MDNATSIELQRLMNACQEDRGGSKTATIGKHVVRCIGVHQSNTNKLSFRFDLDGKRAKFADVTKAVAA
jgi:hypothetical protein